jgi:hypothetical protein
LVSFSFSPTVIMACMKAVCSKFYVILVTIFSEGYIGDLILCVIKDKSCKCSDFN